LTGVRINERRIPMKKRVLVPIATIVALAISGGVAYAVVGAPEVDRANVTISVKPVVAFKSTSCVGEDGISYVTYRGTWKGGEHEVTPGFTDYNLTGPFQIKPVVWTINLTTGRGVLNGTATLKTPATGLLIYSGPLTLITQGLPNTGNGVLGRGWISAPTYGSVDGANVPDGGSLLANVEFQITNTFAATAHFGDAAPFTGIPNYSVTFNNLTC
jgi:hypothetical protein